MLETPTLSTLVFLGRHYRQSYYVRELARVLGIRTGAASGQLRALEESGLVMSEQKGSTVLFRAAISQPVARESKNLRNPSRACTAHHARQNGIRRMILFGSCATGEDTMESDIDLFIETDDRAATASHLSVAAQDQARKISTMIVTSAESGLLRTRDRPLFDRIEADRLLAGEPL